MVRYRRRRRGRGRRSRRVYRRVRRFRPVRRRMLRRRRGGRGFNVSKSVDLQLSWASRVPVETSAYGSKIGVPKDGFCTWCINPLPADLWGAVPGNETYTGTWSQAPESMTDRLIGILGESTMLTDLPVTIPSDMLPGFLNCVALWNICDLYRIRRVSVSFTIPQFTDGASNHHVYLEWCHLPKAQSPGWEDLNQFVLPQDGKTNVLDAVGWNWLCRPIDVAQACSVAGRESGEHSWHRQQLTPGRPVVISWRPRHAALNIDHSGQVYWNHESNEYRITNADMFAQSRKLIRGYLPTDYAKTQQSGQYWLGPVIRLVDTELPANADSSAFGNARSLFAFYGIRCTVTVQVRLRSQNANDVLFPDYNPDNTPG